jgi:four helix bundle protein
MAQASLAEVETQMEIASRLGYLASADLSAVLEQAAVLGKQLYALRNALAKRI